MDFRMYDPAIGRFNGIDPVTHFSQGTSVAFDNNPIFWADPSGANSVGADGFTNDQWMEHFRPGGGGHDAGRAQARQNFQNEVAAGKKISVGEGSFETEQLNPDGTCCASSGSFDGYEAQSAVAHQKRWAKLSKEEQENIDEITKEILTWFIPGGLVLKGILRGGKLVYILYKGNKIVKTIKGGVTVIGKYPKYIKLADKLNANRFSIPPTIWNNMTKAEKWAANTKFLDRMIKSGNRIILSGRIKNIKNVSGYLKEELDYLIGKGYKLGPYGRELIK
jgi:hypothetical protein